MADEPRRPRRFLRRVVIALVLAAIVFVGASWFYAYRFTGPRSRAVGPAPADFPFSISDASWVTEDNHAIRGWFLPSPMDDRAIVLLHGYSGDRRSMLRRAAWLREHGYNVLLYDARACGESAGDMVTMGYHEAKDLAAGLAWLRGKGMKRIACLGVSQGGATILMAADKLGDVRCVVCESVFDELEHAVDRRFRHYLGIPGWLGGCLLVPIAEARTGVPVAAVRPIDGIKKLPCPAFLISGTDDSKTLPEDTQRLFDAAPEPKELWLVPGAAHHDLFSSPEYSDRVLAFLRKHLE